MHKYSKLVVCLVIILTQLVLADEIQLANLTNLENKTIVDFNEGIQSYQIVSHDAKAELVEGKKGWLKLQMGTIKRWPAITFNPERVTNVPGISPVWNLSDSKEIVLNIQNLEDRPIKIYLRVDSPVMTNLKIKPRITSSVTVPAYKTKELSIQLTRGRKDAAKFIGMHVLPQGFDNNGINPAKISAILIFTDRSDKPITFEIGNIRARGVYQQKPWEKLTNKEFFPFIDMFGQFKHDHWPGKITASSDLAEQKIIEERELNNSRRLSGWNQYGGWKNGPKLKATGRFRVEKVAYKWWLVDPAGYLFWSHGLDVIKFNDSPTVISEREHYFADLPQVNDTFSQYYRFLEPNQFDSKAYQRKSGIKTYNFATANVRRKYGKNWETIYPDVVHERLEYWGINTMGLWSNPEWTSMKKTPYVKWMYYRSPKVQGKTKRWKPMIDMWHPDFKQSLERASRNLEKIKDDPWLIGVFVDNEILWLDSIAFINEVLTSPKTQAAKAKLIKILKSKYVNIDELNKSWDTKYTSWQDLMKLRGTNNSSTGFVVDANNFQKISAEYYYKTIRNVIKQKSPEILYLGSRFAGNNSPIAEKAAAKYCDVVSYNFYDESVTNLVLPDQMDKPVIIGEWHFGADDRGVFGRGLKHADNQKDRATKYKKYALSAARHPNIVGIHWFQYMDEMATGRYLDGENHQIGFVSITDTPYTETIRASREFGESMYSFRMQNDYLSLTN